MNVKKKWQGKNPYRYEDNPLEKEFALAWQKENDRPNGGGPLDYLMQPERAGIGVRPDVADAVQRCISSTIIQWLGSPMGQCLLEKVLRTRAGQDFLISRLGAEVRK